LLALACVAFVGLAFLGFRAVPPPVQPVAVAEPVEQTVAVADPPGNPVPAPPPRAGVGEPPATGALRADASRKELKALAGTWRPISAENNGVKSPEESLKDVRWDRDADGKWTLRRDGKAVLVWAVKSLDPTTTPKAIDIEVASGAHEGVVYRGIYELDGDTLRICFALPDKPVRPTEFSAVKGSARALAEFKREKD
jgi:uncharacterized protein (TIGR03067 family)